MTKAKATISPIPTPLAHQDADQAVAPIAAEPREIPDPHSLARHIGSTCVKKAPIAVTLSTAIRVMRRLRSASASRTSFQRRTSRTSCTMRPRTARPIHPRSSVGNVRTAAAKSTRLRTYQKQSAVTVRTALQNRPGLRDSARSPGGPSARSRASVPVADGRERPEGRAMSDTGAITRRRRRELTGFARPCW